MEILDDCVTLSDTAWEVEEGVYGDAGALLFIRHTSELDFARKRSS